MKIEFREERNEREKTKTKKKHLGDDQDLPIPSLLRQQDHYLYSRIN